MQTHRAPGYDFPACLDPKIPGHGPDPRYEIPCNDCFNNKTGPDGEPGPTATCIDTPMIPGSNPPEYPYGPVLGPLVFGNSGHVCGNGGLGSASTLGGGDDPPLIPCTKLMDQLGEYCGSNSSQCPVNANANGPGGKQDHSPCLSVLKA